jgi:hypothetical protein
MNMKNYLNFTSRYTFQDFVNYGNITEIFLVQESTSLLIPKQGISYPSKSIVYYDI